MYIKVAGLKALHGQVLCSLAEPRAEAGGQVFGRADGSLAVCYLFRC